MAGMTAQGFEPKRAADILEEMRLEAAEIVDPATGERPFLNLTDDSVIGQILGIAATGIGDCWAAAGMAAVQFDPLKNYGAGQSGTVQLNAITRKYGEPTVIMMRLVGNAGTLIPAGSLIGTGDGSLSFATMDDVVLDQAGSGTVTARCTETGPHDPEPGTVFAILTPLTGGGWTGAVNVETLSVGTREETDTELRVRQQQSTSLTSYRQIEAIRAAVANVPGVIFSRAYQNSGTYPADERGIPFKEVAVVAVGGEDRAVAEAVFLRLPTGQVGYGNTTETFFDDQDMPYPVSFTRPEELPVFVDLTVTITDRAAFPGNGADRIKDALVAYAAYGGEGNRAGFPPGEDIVRTRLYTPINTVPGHRIDSLRIGTSPDALAEDDIAVPWNVVSAWDAAAIIVTVND
ncbi:MAG: baseplate J/gp47 family protein [Deltaproteobacteria bacterium]|nr:baseplate J/gp47 family protein [Deltaproteobacteria bacterium]